MKHSTVIQLLHNRCRASSQSAVADELGVSKQYLCDVLKGRRDLGQKMLDGLGLQRIVAYRNAPTNGS